MLLSIIKYFIFHCEYLNIPKFLLNLFHKKLEIWKNFNFAYMIFPPYSMHKSKFPEALMFEYKNKYN